jgi:DNA-binding NarL/FixJ family response regulator
MIRLFLADDQALVRSGIRGLLELADDVVVVGEAADGREALDRIEALLPDVALLDVRMPGLSGIEVIQRLAHGPAAGVPCLLLTTFDDDEALIAGLQAGTRGFLLKDISPLELAQAVREVAAGQTLVRPGITDRLLRALQLRRAEEGWQSDLPPPDPLSPREREVLRLMAGGLSNREIGQAMGCAEGTVKNHVSSILSKLGVRDRVRAVLRGIELWL